jgi:SAM-dependent methyltransferase
MHPAIRHEQGIMPRRPMLQPISQVISLFEQVLTDQTLISGVFSNTRTPGAQTYQRVTIKPVMVRQQYLYQFAYYERDKVRHHNQTVPEALSTVTSLLENEFKQANVFTSDADVQILINSKQQARIKRKPPTKKAQTPQHNRTKNHLITEGLPTDFMARLGVMTASGEVIASKYDKFRQINRFLEMVEDVANALPQDRAFQVVDFGCGKAYLTFALYHYLRVIKGLDAHVLGIDRKVDVIAGNSQIAAELGYEHLRFQVGDLETYDAEGQTIDMAVLLHACDTATDEGLAHAIKNGAKVILAAPCCQHELFSQISHPWMTPLTQHGILRERLASLITDAVRAELLEICGYSVQMLEFIDVEHTPKNILIRAVRHKSKDQTLRRDQYIQFRDFWHIHPRLEALLPAEI